MRRAERALESAAPATAAVKMWKPCALVLLFTCIATSQYSDRNRVPGRAFVGRRPHPCEKSSCYPATGNLLIGRESKLHASSTCGLRKQELYCIVSNVEDGKNCFWCDSRNETLGKPRANHRIENIVTRFFPGTREKSWWQAENGKENVTIQLDLEAEFHFTHLIIVFKTFRPAAMFIERSFDFGQTWRVYRYFASRCAEAFPGVPEDVPRKLTDVVCESRYTSVDPSSGGEIIFKVLPPSIEFDNPYSSEVQNLLKMTNLRINFTKLNTLGDDHLDNRAEIKEKYYYSIYDMAVRGSCSCYGHASRCLPLPGVESKTDMVHGRCECTHNTKGLNCEFCEDFFNDLPWQPAYGQSTNACKRCNCNNHATSCHYDPAVYEQTGKVSGGVCDDCQHNTIGRNCEQCRPFYYENPELDIQNPNICQPCDCDPRGSLDDGICDPLTDVTSNQEAGKCHCKQNVSGRRCDVCQEGYWNFDVSNPDGCEECTCDPLGTVNSQGCDVDTGECTCKRYVSGRDCNQCMNEFWGLSDSEEGCHACDCDDGGSLDNNCDVSNGQCKCLPNVQGRKCDQPSQHYFANPVDGNIMEAELMQCSSGDDSNAITSNNCRPIVRESFKGNRTDNWTGPGFMKIYEGDTITFTQNVPKSMEYYVVIRYEPQLPGTWEGATIYINRLDKIGIDSPCANVQPEDDEIPFTLPDNQRSVKTGPACFEYGKNYEVRITFERHSNNVPNSRASVLIDSIVLIPKHTSIPFLNGSTTPSEYNLKEFEDAGCVESYYNNFDKDNIPDICKKYHLSIGFYIYGGGLPCKCDPTGSKSHKCEEYGGGCECKPFVIGRRCGECATGTYGFGPDGCKACDCNSIGSLDNICDLNTGQCKCSPNTYGRQCNECQPGFWNFPTCEQCECNGHADVCDPFTGACTSCRDFSEGHRCERCIEGFYGDPRLGYDIPCRTCRCPDTIDSGHSFAPRCILDDTTNDMICECQEGYSGSRCDVCTYNYFGNPGLESGSCEKCDCNNNIDITKPGNCDSTTGQCLQCLFNTDGDNCEICKAGFFGDAYEKTCEECVCFLLGSNGTICDQTTGQCPCHQNVIGLKCDECLENHWKIASGEGCEPCGCDLTGAVSEQCNIYVGQCECKPGFGGRQCNECRANYWGDPNDKCFECECNEWGSNSSQCAKEDGACVCRPGIGGFKCDQCDRGYIGDSPNCSPCGECFNNWDTIISELRQKTNHVINNASTIKTIGATGAYSGLFDDMENKIEDIRKLLNNTYIGEDEVNAINERENNLRNELQKIDDAVSKENTILAERSTSINLAEVALDDLSQKTQTLNNKVNELNANATKLQEANLEGALNLTRDAKQRSIKAADDADGSQQIIGDSERQLKGTDLFIERQYISFNNTQNDNEKSLEDLQEKLLELESQIPELNDKMCGQASDTCELCGGAGCGKCGGISCERGAVTKADQALDFANKTEMRLKEQEAIAEELIRGIAQAKQNISGSLNLGDELFKTAADYKNTSDYIKNIRDPLLKEMEENLSNSSTSPADIRTLSNQIIGMTIDLEPEQITDLANKINDTVSKLTNIESIIEETSVDLNHAQTLQEQATNAKDAADSTLETAKIVLRTLEEAALVQKAAEVAILAANSDINSTKTDLTPIGSETDAAQRKANETAEEVDLLQKRLTILKKKKLKFENDANQVKNEAVDVVNMAETAQQQARELRQSYQTANSSLSGQLQQSASSRERAQRLLKQATQLAGETQMQLRQLKNMEDLYNSHSQTLDGLKIKIQNLNENMDIYLDQILEKTNFYRTCTA